MIPILQRLWFSDNFPVKTTLANLLFSMRGGLLLIVLGLDATMAIAQRSKATLEANMLIAKLPAEPGTKVVLATVRLHQSDTVAITQADSSGVVRFEMPGKSYHGFYQLVWPGGQNAVLWDGKGLHFEALGPDSVLIHHGTSWKIYRDTRSELIKLRLQLQLLDQLTVEFPQATAMLQGAQAEVERLEAAEALLIRRIHAPDSDLGLRLLGLEAPFVGNRPERLRNELKPGRYLNLMDLSDTVHLYHNVLPKMVVEYYRLFEPDSVYSEEIQAMRFVESIMNHLKTNPRYVVPVADFLRLGLQQMQQPKALQLLSHQLSENNSCSDPELERKLRDNLRHYAPISQGAKTPRLNSLVNAAGQAVDLQPTEGLYVFWAADCDHCLVQLPKLYRWWSSKHSDWAVTTISVGGSTQNWSSTIATLPGWTHLQDPLGRQGPTVEAYVLYATPLFVKVDRNGLIADVFRAESSLELTYP
ncbi:MAG: hypothetical protein FJ343_04140 [Sphingomonadales bacterium]|nr:hypothetical protein [Sphingomonadales bacterium]